MVITLDLVSYDVTSGHGGAQIIIHDCAGSILSKLDTSKGSRFAEDYQYARLPSGQWVYVEYDADDETCTFSSTNREPIDFDDILEWISQNYDAIESIGWEVLEKSND